MFGHLKLLYITLTFAAFPFLHSACHCCPPLFTWCSSYSVSLTKASAGSFFFLRLQLLRESAGNPARAVKSHCRCNILLHLLGNRVVLCVCMCVCVWVPWQVPGRERRTPRCPGECGDDELNKQANRLTVPRRRLLSTACPPVLTLSERERRGGKIKGRDGAGGWEGKDERNNGGNWKESRFEGGGKSGTGTLIGCISCFGAIWPLELCSTIRSVVRNSWGSKQEIPGTPTTLVYAEKFV